MTGRGYSDPMGGRTNPGKNCTVYGCCPMAACSLAVPRATRRVEALSVVCHAKSRQLNLEM